MIRGFKNAVTEAVFNGLCPKGFPVQIFVVARRKLEALDAAEQLTGWSSCGAVERANIRSASTTNGAFVFVRPRVDLSMSGSWTITEGAP